MMNVLADRGLTDEVASLVIDNERGLADMSSMISDGTFMTIPRDDMYKIATRATQSSIVVANAFGQDLLPGETPDVFRDRVMSMYDTARFYRAANIASACDGADRAVSEDTSRFMISRTLGLDQDTVSGLDTAKESGDPAAWQLERERFYFK